METSAKTAMNVNDIFLAIGECIPACGRFRNIFLQEGDWFSQAGKTI